MTPWTTFLAGALLAFALALTQGCALNPGETRRITAYGIFAEAYGFVVGVGYWQSERGPNVKDQPADKPSGALKALPGKP